MRLSEAIRAGAKMKPMGIGASTADPHSEKVCALGAAACGGGLTSETQYSVYNALSTRWPILREKVHQDVPRGATWRGDVMEHIWTRNDAGKTTREEIADWVAQAEEEALKCGTLTREQLGYD